jgi:hypothetical protein
MPLSPEGGTWMQGWRLEGLQGSAVLIWATLPRLTLAILRRQRRWPDALPPEVPELCGRRNDARSATSDGSRSQDPAPGCVSEASRSPSLSALAEGSRSSKIRVKTQLMEIPLDSWGGAMGAAGQSPAGAEGAPNS